MNQKKQKLENVVGKLLKTLSLKLGPSRMRLIYLKKKAMKENNIYNLKEIGGTKFVDNNTEQRKIGYF